MASMRIRDIRDSVTGAFCVGFRRINQLRCLLQIFFSREHQDINLLLTQGWRQAHNAFQPIGTHDARLLIAEIVAWEECGWRHDLIEDQHVRREDAGLFSDFTG